MPKESAQSGPSGGRRAFFRLGLGRMLRPMAGYLEQRIDLPELRPVLRPPGARPESEFLDRCYRCGNCADVCPVSAIRLHPSDDESLGGTPFIDASATACVVCSDIACTHACPSGALEPLTNPAHIRMGLAIVDQAACVRSEGEDCRECIDKCPIGEGAIRLDRKGRVEVLSDGCVGCGVCQLYCPTKPEAIVVDPD